MGFLKCVEESSLAGPCVSVWRETVDEFNELAPGAATSRGQQQQPGARGESGCEPGSFPHSAAQPGLFRGNINR